MSEATNRADFESAMKALGWGAFGFAMRYGEYEMMWARAAWDAWQARGASVAASTTVEPVGYIKGDVVGKLVSVSHTATVQGAPSERCNVPLYTAPPADTVNAELVAGWQRRDEWFAMMYEIGKLVDCLASAFPEGNAHIVRRIAALSRASTEGTPKP